MMSWENEGIYQYICFPVELPICNGKHGSWVSKPYLMLVCSALNNAFAKHKCSPSDLLMHFSFITSACRVNTLRMLLSKCGICFACGYTWDRITSLSFTQ
jgi:hypothetical protein